MIYYFFLENEGVFKNPAMLKCIEQYIKQPYQLCFYKHIQQRIIITVNQDEYLNKIS